jgi:SAM-dependent methyltransferase
MQVDSKELSRLFYDGIGKSGLSSRTRPSVDKAALKTVENLLLKHQFVLDVGCGYGRIAATLMGKGFNIHGIDVSSKLVAEARQSVPFEMRSHFRVADMCHIPFKNNKFDVVLCLWSAFSELLYAREQVLALKEMNRVLRNDGLCFIEMGNYKIPTKNELAEGKYCGHGKRIRKDVLFGMRNYHFNHNRESLMSALARARISNGIIVKEMFAGRMRQILKFTKA